MIHIIVRHKVKDHNAWKKVFNDFVDTGRAGGEKSYVILHPDQNTNDLVLYFECDSKQNADRFFSSARLKSAMENAGVAGQPRIEFFSEFARGTV